MQDHSTRRLTQGFVQGLSYRDKSYAVRDTAVTGLFVEVNKRSASYKVQRDLWVGERGRRRLVKTVRRTLAAVDEISLDEARTRALQLIARIKRGEDPNASAGNSNVSAVWSVERMYHEYAEDMRRRECTERFIGDVLSRLDRYLRDWKLLPIAEIKKSMARDRHALLSTRHGKRTANMAMKDFRWAYNLALRVIDEPDALGDNPTNAITWNKERSSNRVIMPDDLPQWWVRLQTVTSPLRRAMHELGLFSGLRPGTLVSLRREWIDFGRHAIHIPKMKSGRAFDLPLSPRMEQVIRDALAVGDAEQPWLFPTRGRADRKVKHAQVWKEAALPSETGHILRHTYRTIAKRAGVDQIDARLLLDHTVPGIDGVYIHERALFDRLLHTQEVMTRELLLLCKAPIEGGLICETD